MIASYSLESHTSIDFNSPLSESETFIVRFYQYDHLFFMTKIVPTQYLMETSDQTLQT